MRHFETGGAEPPELTVLRLCRDVYHCPPAQLPSLSVMLAHLTCLAEEAKHRGA